MSAKSTYRKVIITASVTMGLFGFVTIFSCNKSEETDNGTYTIAGTVYEDCSKKPFANQQLQLVHIASSGSCSDQLLKTYTDNNGNFSFSYDGSCKEYLLSDEYQILMLSGTNTGNILYTRIPGKQNIHLKEMYAARKNILPLKISGYNTLNRRDTLFVGVSENMFTYFYPIKPLDTVLSLTPGPLIYSDNGGTYTDIKVYYALGKDNFKKTIADVSQHNGNNSFTINDNGCAGRVVDTLNILLQ